MDAFILLHVLTALYHQVPEKFNLVDNKIILFDPLISTQNNTIAVQKNNKLNGPNFIETIN